jgi:flagellar biosynthesis activator protein FlaF
MRDASQAGVVGLKKRHPMYQFSYAEILDDSPKEARERERAAMDRAIELLQAAERAGVHSGEATEATQFVRRLWAALIEDLSKAENALPQSLRADLISVGLWIMREAEQIRLGKSTNFKGIIEVSAQVREGLQ